MSVTDFLATLRYEGVVVSEQADSWTADLHRRGLVMSVHFDPGRGFSVRVDGDVDDARGDRELQHVRLAVALRRAETFLRQ